MKTEEKLRFDDYNDNKEVITKCVEYMNLGVSKVGIMEDTKWICCPVCHSKTRLKVRMDTELKNFPLYCPKCRQENLINVKQLKISVINEAG